MKTLRINRSIIVLMFLGLISMILENFEFQNAVIVNTSHTLDFIVFFLFVSIYLVSLIKSPNKSRFIKRNVLETLLVLAAVAVLVYAKYHFFFIIPYAGHNISTKVIFAITLFYIFKVLMRMKRLQTFFRNLTLHPAQTIMLSFVAVILVGTILLMMPLSTADNTKLGFVNSIFTATSATCVTGLIVVDTAARFSHFGKIVIMLLIQVGGLGIMILAFFTAFLLGKKLSFQDKLTISYMLEENDARNLTRGIRNIILFTFAFEICGALLLFLPFRETAGGDLQNLFYSLFHAVSAFCNAGFALFSDNFEGFRSFGFFNFVIAGLIIAGGISFAVLSNSFMHVRSLFRRRFSQKDKKLVKLTLNTRVVLIGTAILIISGTLLIYLFEHKENLLPLDLKTQYLEAFFQSVTLRTAGFNTMDISKLHTGTYALMILFMFIGGASGSTAGGVKVNTLGIAWAYVRSVFTNKEDMMLYKYSISKEQVNQAFLVIFLSITVVFFGALLLTFSEGKAFVNVIFETVSAFGTVGLSTGITPELTDPGKILITLIMFIGRLGPLTIVTALAQRSRHIDVRYPAGRINIG
jgi:trk system potassium uptake protein TrkH